MYYKLDSEGEPIPCDLMEWARWYETGQRSVAMSQVNSIWVSTIFLGLDHAFLPGAAPKLFETMLYVFKRKPRTVWRMAINREFGGLQLRYPTKQAAIASHEALCAQIRNDMRCSAPGYSASHWRKICRESWLSK